MVVHDLIDDLLVDQAGQHEFVQTIEEAAQEPFRRITVAGLIQVALVVSGRVVGLRSSMPTQPIMLITPRRGRPIRRSPLSRSARRVPRADLGPMLAPDRSRIRS